MLLREVAVSTTTCGELIKKYGTPHYVKVDIEGFDGDCMLDLAELPCASLPSFISFEELGFSSRDEKEKLISYLVDSDDDALTMTRMKELKAAVAKAIELLPEKERLVISLYYLDELTMKETGKVLNVTESRVSQIHSQAIMRLRSKLKKEKLIGD